MPSRDRQAAAAREAAAEAARAAPRPKRGGSDPITGELRRRDVLPLLVLHYISGGPCYGNQLMERIASLTAGVLNINTAGRDALICLPGVSRELARIVVGSHIGQFALQSGRGALTNAGNAHEEPVGA